MNRKVITVLLLASAAAGAAYYKGMLPGATTAHAPAAASKETALNDVAPMISVIKPQRAEFRETVLVSGSLVAREEILVAPEIEGLRVMELFADEGSSVKKGDVLARLVSEQLDAQIAQNDAAKARAIAAIAQAQSQIVQAKARAKEAVAQLERAEPLKKSGYLSGSTYDQRESAAGTAQAQIVAAEDGLKAAEAEKAQVEAQRRELDWRRSNTEVKAPADGVVSRRNARIGAMASSIADPMFRIIQNSEVELDAEIVETDLFKIKTGQNVRVSAPGGKDVEGRVRLVSPEVDKTTRLGRVRVFLGAQPELKIGAFARGVVDTAQASGIALPASAVTFATDGPHVQLVKGNVVERRAVKTGLQSAGLLEIVEGVSLDDVVVARAGTFLRDGDKIRPVEPADTVSEAR
ncbi:MAG: efflux RND transporter periplasmic adaptor subunit [Hyphomicrobium sp.]|nr:efflux RND transporter periplasmic adaptor subunit [Hyphomicrobium sp.]